MTFLKTVFFSIPLFITFLTTQSLHAQNGTIHLTVQNIQKAEGKVMIAVFKGEENFLEDGKAIAAKIALVEKTGAISATFPNLPIGDDYSIAVYHDVNGNEKLNTNLFGVPTEPYGFSNNARSKWGAPKYDIARFELNQSPKNMVIQVKKWSKQ